jgi:hypothetical protein
MPLQMVMFISIVLLLLSETTGIRGMSCFGDSINSHNLCCFDHRYVLSSRCVKSTPSFITPMVTIPKVNTSVPGSR